MAFPELPRTPRKIMKDDRTFRTTLVACLLIVRSVAYAQVDGIPEPVRTINVSNDSQLKQALASAKPGDHLVLEDGDYSGSFELKANGTKGRPIVVRARNLLKARFTSVSAVAKHGKAALKMLAGDHNILWGMDIDPERFGLVATKGDYCKILRCRFRNSQLYIIGGKATEVAFCEFHDMPHISLIVRPLPFYGVKEVRIYRNYFHDYTGTGNGHEAICLGLGAKESRIDAGNIVEYNVFRNVNTPNEAEIISVKSSNNIIRFNTFLNSPVGNLSGRHGNDNQFLGNWIENCGGMNIRGARHRILGNKGIKARIRLFAGNRTPTDEPFSGKYLPAASDCLIAGNDFDLVVGYNPKWPGWGIDTPAKNNRVEKHTGSITQTPATELIGCSSAA